MTAVIDTNVILDVLLRRSPYFGDSSNVLKKAELGEFTGIVCSSVVTDIYYIARKMIGHEKALAGIEDLVSICSLAPVNHSVVNSALKSKFGDFEDAIVHFCGKAAGGQCIVTRNETDFSTSDLTVYTPPQFLAALQGN